jgi:hypothetical protein
MKANVHSIEGGITADDLDFWCVDCGTRIPELRFYSEDAVGVRLRADCPNATRRAFLS